MHGELGFSDKLRKSQIKPKFTYIRFMKVVALLPARLGSTRFPEKMLADLGGKPLIVRTWEAVQATHLFAEVLVVTDHERILQAVEAHGGSAVMSSPEHQSGSDRIAEIALRLDADVLVNVQGDEPFVQRESLAALLRCFEDARVRVASLMCRVGDYADFHNPNVVKVVCNQTGDALYFSRAAVPFPRDLALPAQGLLPEEAVPAGVFQHIGVYGYRKEALLAFTAMPPCALELTEKLEQLRLLYHGIPIRMAEVAEKSIGIDTLADLERARKLMV
jgi:3-deoxy-manno-octulosonate cytidylyltransferase (CMP-KDO synthetase)